jgi:hypothetical protein
MGGRPATSGASLPRSCTSRRRFTIHLRVAPKTVRSVTIAVDGRRAKVLRGRHVRATIDLRGLPKGAFRVLVTVQRRHGKPLRTARTYRTCVRRR